MDRVNAHSPTGGPEDPAAPAGPDTILERVADGILTVDRSWRISAANAAARRTLGGIPGVSGEDLVGRVLWEAFPGLLGTRFEDEYRRAMESQQAAHFEAFSPASQAWYNVDLYPSREGVSVYFRDVTERRRAEEALRENEGLFRQLAESIQEVLWVISPDRQHLDYVNPAFEQIYGRPREDAYADPELLLRLIVPEDRERVRAAFERVADGGYDTEYRITRPDGEVRWLWARGAAVRGENGEVMRVVGISEDITGRKETEEQRLFLAEAGRVLSSSLDYEETLRTVARLAVPEIADWAAIHVQEQGELRAIEVAHVDPEKVALARDLAERYPEEPTAATGVYHVLRTGESEFYPDIPPELLDAAAQDEEHRRLIHALGLRSGMTVPMIARGRTIGAITFIAAESGRRYTKFDLYFAQQLAARAALAVDNARLFAEASRRATEERALRVAARAVSASFTVDEVIEQIARSAVDATRSDGAVVERVDAAHDQVEVIAVFGSGGYAKGETVPLQGSFAEYVLQRGEAVYVERLDRSERPLPTAILEGRPDWSALVLPLGSSEGIGALFLLRKPERRRITAEERDRAAAFADLAALAFRKVHMLQESERQRRDLEEVMESRARLVRGFTHDLRNPLGAAAGFLDLIKSGVYGDLSPQQSAGLERMQRLLHSALGLISDVLELARVESGQLEIEPETVDVAEAARELTESYRAQAQAKGLQLELVLPEDLPLVQSDATRIRQIVGNLLSNAVKYTSSGRVTVSAEVRDEGPLPTAAEWIAISVSDTGPGIPAEKQSEVFQEFNRAGEQAHAGAGLGLAISRNLAEALGGALTLQSEAGRGATFTLWLPPVLETTHKSH